MPFPLHRLDKAEGRHRIDEGRSALLRRHIIRQDHAGARIDDPILREHAAADQGNSLAKQGLRFGRAASIDDGASAFIADRHGLTHATGERATRRIGHARNDAAFAIFGILKIGRGEQQREVRRVDGCGLHTDQHLVILWRRERLVRKLNRQATVLTQG